MAITLIRYLRRSFFLLFAWALLSSCQCQNSQRPADSAAALLDSSQTVSGSKEKTLAGQLAPSFRLSSVQVWDDLHVLTESPHPFGSPRQEYLAKFLSQRLTSIGLAPKLQNFSAQVPVPGSDQTMLLEGQNVYAGLELGGAKSCVILFGSHYDTKPMPEPQLGANDSGSSSVALLQMAAFLLQHQPVLTSRCDVGFVWFDGEEAQLPGWDDGLRHPSRSQDNTYGSRNFVAKLTSCGRNQCLPESLDPKQRAVRALILLDMIGAEPMILSQDSHTSEEFRELLGPVLQGLGMSQRLSAAARAISDDHLPFLKRGIPSINLINFEITTHWHRPSDTVDKISLQSIEDFSQIAISLAVNLPPI